MLVLLWPIGCADTARTPVGVDPVFDDSGMVSEDELTVDATFREAPADLRVPGICVSQMDDPVVGARCRSLMARYLSGEYGEEARQEALRVQR